jgi:hypothetical protein
VHARRDSTGLAISREAPFLPFLASCVLLKKLVFKILDEQWLVYFAMIEIA